MYVEISFEKVKEETVYAGMEKTGESVRRSNQQYRQKCRVDIAINSISAGKIKTLAFIALFSHFDTKNYK